MLISKKFKLVYVHIPKCAGIGLRKKLTDLDPDCINFWSWEWDKKLSRYIDKAHMALSDCLHYKDIRDALRDYFVFTIVRNPYERFFSATDEHIYQHDIPRNKYIYGEILESLDPTKIRYNAKYVHFCPMHYFTHIGNKCIVDEIYYLDSLDYGLTRLCQIAEINPKLIFPFSVHNIKSGDHRENIYSLLRPDHINTINTLYDRDFFLYGFQKIDPDLLGEFSEAIKASHSNWPDLCWRIQGNGNPRRFDAIKTLLDDINALKEQHENLINESLKLRQSYSWRVTKPLRYLSRILRLQFPDNLR